jgi:hypothetical protein
LRPLPHIVFSNHSPMLVVANKYSNCERAGGQVADNRLESLDYHCMGTDRNVYVTAICFMWHTRAETDKKQTALPSHVGLH